MISVAEVARRREALRETEARLLRMATGANLSDRYALDLRDWLAGHHPGDARFDALLEVLGRYRSMTGAPEVVEACQALLGQLRREAEGPRLRWTGTPAAHEAPWNSLFSSCDEATLAAAACPCCGARALRRYLRRHGEEGPAAGGAPARAGLWEWCRGCLAYRHLSARVPAGWGGDPVLDLVPFSLLEHSPEFLERALREAEG